MQAARDESSSVQVTERKTFMCLISTEMLLQIFFAFMEITSSTKIDMNINKTCKMWRKTFFQARDHMFKAINSWMLKFRNSFGIGENLPVLNDKNFVKSYVVDQHDRTKNPPSLTIHENRVERKVTVQIDYEKDLLSINLQHIIWIGMVGQFQRLRKFQIHLSFKGDNLMEDKFCFTRVTQRYGPKYFLRKSTKSWRELRELIQSEYFQNVPLTVWN